VTPDSGTSDDWIACLLINAVQAELMTLAFNDDFVAADQQREHLQRHTRSQRYSVQNTEFLQRIRNLYSPITR